MLIKTTCKGQIYLPVKALKDFQGRLKTVSRDDLERAKRSILRHGFSFPLLIWGSWLIDGHQRLLAVRELVKEGHTIGKLPCVEIEAKSRAEAAEKLLLVNSRYGRITEDGLTEFLAKNGVGLDGLADEVMLPDIDIHSLLGRGLDGSVFFGDAEDEGKGSHGESLSGAGHEDQEFEKRITIKSFPAFLGAFCLHQAKGDFISEMKAWKASPQNHKPFEQRMAGEFTEALLKRSNHFDFLTVPPPNGKRVNGYDGYPIVSVAEQVAGNLGLKYLEVFEPRKVKTRRGVGARVHQDQAEIALYQNVLNGFGSCLLLDDVSTTRWTVTECQRVLAAAGICTMALVYLYWGNV